MSIIFRNFAADFENNIKPPKRKEFIMASYAIHINERTQAGQSLFLYLNSLGVITERLQSRRRKGIDAALEDVRMGRVYKADSVDDMFRQILG